MYLPSLDISTLVIASPTAQLSMGYTSAWRKLVSNIKVISFFIYSKEKDTAN
jgi:hypothetical protein